MDNLKILLDEYKHVQTSRPNVHRSCLKNLSIVFLQK